MSAHTYIYITMYLPHSSYMFRCAIYHLQGEPLVFLLKTTCFFLKVVINGDLRHRISYNVIYND